MSDILDLIRVENSCDYRYLQEKDREYLVEVRGNSSRLGIEPPIMGIYYIKSNGYNISCKSVLNHPT